MQGLRGRGWILGGRRDSFEKVVLVAERCGVFIRSNAHLICSNLVEELLAGPLNTHTQTHTQTKKVSATHTRTHILISLTLLPLD